MAVDSSHPQIGDHELAGAAQRGAKEAFTLLVERHYTPLLRYLIRHTDDPELAADLAQEAFAGAYRCLQRMRNGDGEESFAGWLYGIGHNHLRQYLRHLRKYQFIPLSSLPDQPLTATPTVPLWADVERSHERDLVHQALADLSPALCEALLLHSHAGYSAPEIAIQLGISRSAAERRISRAKAQFRACYEALSKEDDCMRTEAVDSPK